MKSKIWIFAIAALLAIAGTAIAECAEMTGDGKVDLFDLVFVALRVGNPAGDPADIFGNDGVNIQDLQEVAKQFGQECTRQPAEGFTQVNLKQLPYSMENTELLKSATFYNATSTATENIFFTQFPNSKISRTSLFEYYLGESTDTASFINGLNNSKQTLQKLADQSSALVVVIAKMPLWLSSSQDTGPVSSGNWKVYNTHSPKDFNQWKETIKAGVSWFKQFNKPVYYEVWNEPDFDFFWSEDTNSLLRLYKETALAVKEADTEAKVGGLAVNGWNGKIDSQSQAANIELIRFAKKEGIPLDFVSWHYFSTRSQDINSAMQALLAELRAQGFSQTPEFLITEWNNPKAVRVSNLAPAILADTLIVLDYSGINGHTYSAFQDFSTIQDNSDYGLVKKNGTIKPVFYVFKAFDAMAQNTQGIYFQLSADNVQRTLVSKKANGCFDILFWDLNAAALESTEPKTYKLEFDGNISSASGFSVKGSFQQKQPLVSGSRLTFNTEINSFNAISVCLE
ncbi:MAG: hypothetical protein Q7R70_04660 [Candidatus Diapherotrites archaeon]|nr:hypothetical protein [Candidatus Diapherotrites archaeon]